MAEAARGFSKVILVTIAVLIFAIAILFFVLAGLALSADNKKLEVLKKVDGHTKKGGYILIGIGFVWLLASLIGLCAGFKRQSIVFPILFGILLFLLTILMIVVSVVLFKGKELDKAVDEIIRKDMLNYRPNNQPQPKENIWIDNLQRTLKCCGLHNPNDWRNETIAKVWMHKNDKNVPPSCCQEKHKDVCDTKSIKLKYAYEQGCYTKITEFVKKNFTWIGGVSIGLSVLLVLGFVGTVVLCITKRDSLYNA